MNSDILEVESSFKHLGNSFSKDEGPRENVQNKVDEGLKTCGSMKMIFSARSVRFAVKRDCMKEW